MAIVEKLQQEIETSELELVTMVAAQNLWLRRNKVIFGGMLSHPNILVSKTMESLEAFHSANARRQNQL